MTTVLTKTANDLITSALRKAGIIRPRQVIQPDDLETALEMLNIIFKSWDETTHLWAQEEIFLPLNVGQPQYALGAGGDNATLLDDVITTTTTTDLVVLDVVVTVASTVGMSGAPELITTNPIDTQFWTVGNSATITDTNGLELTSSPSGIGFADFDLTCDVGATYRMTFGYVKGTDIGATFSVIDPKDSSVIQSVAVSADDPAIVLEFTATQEIMTFRFSNDTVSNEAFANFLGGSGDDFSTPDSTATSQTGDFQIIADIEPDDWDAFQTIAAKWDTSGNRSYIMDIPGAANSLRAQLSDDGSSSDTPLSGDFTTTGRNNVSIKYDDTVPDVEFFITDLVTPVATVGTTEGSIFDGTASFFAGGRTDGGGPFAGKIYKLELFDNTSSVVVDFDPNDYVSGSSWVSATTGETWTLNGSATITAAFTATNTLTSLSQIDKAGGDFIGIQQEDNTRHWTDIVAVLTSTTLEIDTGMPSASASGSTVYTYTDELERPLRMYTPRIQSLPNGSEIPIDMISRMEYMNQVQKESAGFPNIGYYSPELVLGQFFVWQTASNANFVWKATCDFSLEVAEQTAIVDLPSAWYEYAIWALAYDLIGEYAVPEKRIAWITQKKQETQIIAEAFDDQLYGDVQLGPAYAY